MSLVKILNDNNLLLNWVQKEITPSMTDVFVSFLMSIQSENTRRGYKKDICDFIIYMNKLNINIDYIYHIEEKTIILWHEYLNTKTELSQSSVRRKLNSLAALLKFSCKRKLLNENPILFLKRPKLKNESKTNAFTVDEVKTILSYLKNSYSKCSSGSVITHKRNYASHYLSYVVLLTLFSVGMRINELCSLKIKDLEFTDTYTKIHMIAKGNEEHSVIINNNTAEILKNYIQNMRSHAKPTDFIFVRSQNVTSHTKLTQASVYYMLTKAAKAVGIDKKVSPHSCRATLATFLHSQGIPITQIMNLLNHKDITTTMIYIKKANELTEAAAAKIKF